MDFVSVLEKYCFVENVPRIFLEEVCLFEVLSVYLIHQRNSVNPFLVLFGINFSLCVSHLENFLMDLTAS